jgi:hypothetical protein
MGVLGGRKQVSNPSTMNGEGIINHLLGKQQLEAAQIVSQNSGLQIWKSNAINRASYYGGCRSDKKI